MMRQNTNWRTNKRYICKTLVDRIAIKMQGLIKKAIFQLIIK